MLILYEPWACARLVLKKAVPRYRRPGRPFSVSAVPFIPGIDIWRSCRFIGALFRSLCALPDIGASHCRLRHIGCEKCGQGLTSRPRESPSEGFKDEQLLLFRYPLGLPLLFWRVHCLFGTVLVGLPVGPLLGACLLVVTLLTLLLRRVRRLVLFGWRMVLLLICLASTVVVELTGLVGLVEA